MAQGEPSVSNQFDLDPELVRDLTRPMPPGLIDRVTGWIDAIFPVQEGPALKIVAVLSAVFAAIVLRVTASLSKSWANYTRGSVGATALTGHAIISTPALVAIAVSSYLVKRAFFYKKEAPRSTF